MSSYRYRITVEALPSDRQTRDDLPPSYSFDTSTHDDLFRIMDVMRRAEMVHEEEASALALGLKLFAETVLRHRQDPRFAPFEAPLRQLIGSLKQAAAR